MKNKIYLGGLIALAIAFTSCKKEDNSNSSGSSSSSNVSAFITTGSWRINYFHEGGNDHTSNFGGYTFTFSANGMMAAVDSSGSTSGTWRIDDSNVNEFRMSIGSSSPLLDLNHGWIVISQSASEIDMKDDDLNHSEELHFVKI